MQPFGTHSALSQITRLATQSMLIGLLLVACVSHVYKPGAAENPLNHIKLYQTYGDMVRILGEPDGSQSQDRMGMETFILFMPVWNIIESIGDFNPSTIQVYRYDRWGTVTVDNENHIIRIEGKRTSD